MLETGPVIQQSQRLTNEVHRSPRRTMTSSTGKKFYKINEHCLTVDIQGVSGFNGQTLSVYSTVRTKCLFAQLNQDFDTDFHR